ncbi:hypothetical protein N0B31_07510 [Salinirubellus salinus]|jgi:hypothetical protein|uniref:DUF8072 domain-containing protein n=1 Tax=Salinirubellus salinus TaxID=1364945 RepID=A0A9E7U656_9EURY|nr:hypothetical protein [Salinirubellus salinus]UWM56130.1 hypothetical protein N0B31_07510 [Salinirubellus salinus]
MNTLAKRVHNITPKPVRLTLDDGSTVDLRMRSAEFFQEAFQAEGVDDDDVTYRLVTDGEDDPLVAGRERESGGWESVGEVVDVTHAEE